MSLRAVAYLRYSSDNQRAESIDAQLKAIKEYCKRKGYILVGTYTDEAKTATTDRRPDFQRMMADSSMGIFDVVVVHKRDRFARDRYDSAFYKRLLKKNNVLLESVLEQFDNSPESIILESVLDGMAEYYSANLAREARKGMAENAEKGLHAGGRPPYGYKVNPETLKYEIDEKTYRAVQIYFEGIASGLSVPQIVELLNEQGFRTRTGRKFTKNSFDGWASNQKYKGVYTWDVASAKNEDGKRNTHKKKPVEQQVIIPGAIPAIVSKELWEKVNAIMADRKKKPGAFKSKILYLLTGKVRCGKCGANYAGNSYVNHKGGNHLRYYRCAAKCGNTGVRKEDLEHIVIEQLVENCFTDAAMIEVARKVQDLYREQKASSQQDIQPIKREIAETEKKLNNWIEAIGEGLLDKNVLAEKIKEANQRKVILESELHHIEVMNSINDIDEKLIIDLLEQKKHSLFSDSDEEKKQVLQEFVQEVIILPSRDINNFYVELTCRVFNGGGGGIRTPVRKQRYISISERSHSFTFR